MSEYTRRDVKEFRWQYRALVVKGDLPGFELLLEQYGAHLSAAEKREFVEQFKRDAANALRTRWRSLK
jgi:23S rRNA G2069 N7-methylase RlmK/C1962 C5-methylase RlmI